MSLLGGHLPKSSSEGSSLVQLLPSNSNGTILPFLRPKPQLPRPQSFNLNPLLETIATASARRYVISSGSKPEKFAWLYGISLSQIRKWKWTCWMGLCGSSAGRFGSRRDSQEWNSWMNCAVKSGIWRNALISSVVYERSSVAGLSLNTNRGYSVEAKTFLHAPVDEVFAIIVNGL